MHTGQTFLVKVYKTFGITQEASHDGACEDSERRNIEQMLGKEARCVVELVDVVRVVFTVADHEQFL